MIFISTEVSFAAMGGGSSSSSSSSSSTSYSSSSDDSGPYTATNRFKEINKLIKLEKFAEAHKLLKNLKKFDGLVSSLVSELRDAFDFKENNKSSVCVFNYQKETAVDTVKLN